MERTIYHKLAELQFHVGKLERTGTAPHRRHKYVELNTILDALAAEVQALNLAFFQPIQDGKVKTIAVDLDTGEQLISEIELPRTYDDHQVSAVIYTGQKDHNGKEVVISKDYNLPQAVTPQSIGSAITYYRRYTLTAMLSLQADDDDAENASTGRRENQTHTRTSSASQADHPASPEYDWKGREPIEAKPDEEKNWLNQFTKKGGTELTTAFTWCAQKIAEGYTVSELRNYYKINRETAAALQTAAQTATA